MRWMSTPSSSSIRCVCVRACRDELQRSSGKSGSVVLSLIVRCGFGRYDAEEDREAIAEGVEGAQKKHRQKKKQKKKRKGDDDEDEEECSRILGKLDHKFHVCNANLLLTSGNLQQHRLGRVGQNDLFRRLR